MNLSKTQLIESLFTGDGEMSARMRALDWLATPLGPVEHWPQSLRISIRIMLGSGYPISISWGPDYTFLYNDAWRPIQGQTKHPSGLGRSCREVWSEIWDFIGPKFDRVMTQSQHAGTLGDQLLVLNRNNYMEESYFAFSFSPIPDDASGVGGVITTALETTERVIEDRRRLFKLAGRPAKEQVVHVFGDAGVAWTWVARAKAVGMKSAEEVARRFPELLKKPSKSALVTKH